MKRISLTQDEAKDAMQRLLARVRIDEQTGCHEWLGAKTDKGYGSVRVCGQTLPAHRVFFIAAKGEIPQGLCVDHLCRNRACCNISHLEIVTVRENSARGIGRAAHAIRTDTCKRGHAFTDENTYWVAGPRGGRRCRACNRASANYRRKRDNVQMRERERELWAANREAINARRRARYTVKVSLDLGGGA